MRKRRRVTEGGALLVLIATVVVSAGLSFGVALDGGVKGAAAGVMEARTAQGLPPLVTPAHAAERPVGPEADGVDERPVGPETGVAPQGAEPPGGGEDDAPGFSLAALVNGALAGAAVVALALVRAGRRGTPS